MPRDPLTGLYRRPTVACVCTRCGTTFQKERREVHPGKRDYCSVQCREGRKPGHTMVTLTCDHCGVQFEKWIKRAKYPGRKYCSNACRHLGHQKYARDLTCLTCGALITNPANKSRSRRMFCSQACYNVQGPGRDPIPVWTPTPQVAAYLAGLMDGDGTFDVQQNGTGARLRVRIGMTDLAVLEWIKEIFPGQSTVNRRGTPKERHRQMYDWNCHSVQAAAFLAAIEPFLILKRSQARIALDFARQETTRVSPEVLEQMKALKREYCPEGCTVVLPPYDAATFWPYLAGFWDAEGTISVRTNKALYLSVSNTHGCLIHWIRDHLAPHITVNMPRKPAPHHHQHFHFSLSGNAWRPLIERLLPFLIVKKPRAYLWLTLSLYHPAAQPPEHDAVLQELISLNSRGFNVS